jgi:hypothetical protein
MSQERDPELLASVQKAFAETKDAYKRLQEAHARVDSHRAKQRSMGGGETDAESLRLADESMQALEALNEKLKQFLALDEQLTARFPDQGND